MKQVYCIGELLIDFVAEKQGNDLSKASSFTKKAGGAPANVACAIAKLGGSSKFIGCVGNDPFGNFLLKILDDINVDISLSQRSRSFTTLAFVSLTKDGERDFVFARGADKKLKYDPQIKKEFKGNILHLGAATAFLGGDLEKAYGRYFFDALTLNTFISFDPNFRGDLWKGEEEVFVKKCAPFIEKAHLCKFSMEEARILSGEKDLKKACDIIHEIGAQIVIVTLGSKGTLVSTFNKKEIIGSIEVDQVDSTGAGDAFVGCLLQQISILADPHDILNDYEHLLKMVKNANKAGALTTTNFGAIPSLPTREAVFDSSEPHQ